MIASKGSIVAQEDKDRRYCRKWIVSCSCKGKKYQQRFSGTYKEAQAALEELREKAQEDQERRRKNIPVIDDYARAYFDTKLKLGSINKITYDGYLNRANVFLPYISGKTLDEISSSDIEQAFASLKSRGRPDGKPLSGTYLNGISKTISGVFTKAIRDGYISTNPVTEAETPKTDTKSRKALTSEQAKNLIAALDVTEPVQMAILLCVTTGLRRREAMSVKWKDVVDGKLTVRASKTNSGIRTIPLTKAALAALDKRRSYIYDNIGNYDEDTLQSVIQEWPICSKLDGKSLLDSAVSHWFLRNRNRLGIPDTTVHDLRHTYATLLAESGASPAAMQRLLGHASPVMSLKIYTHVHDDQLEAATEQLDSLL